MKIFIKRKLLKFIIFCIKKYFSYGIENKNNTIYRWSWTKELEKKIKE
jgi:hypothetical protein